MGRVKIPYYVVKHGKGYWQPTKSMRAMGFQSRGLGQDGPAAWAEAWRLCEDWQRVRKGLAEPPARSYPVHSIGWAWERFRRTETWAKKAPRTREDWDRGWRWIEPVFGDVLPSTVEIEDIEALRSIVAQKVSPGEAYRVIKIWRAFWQKMASMHLCERDADPSKVFANSAPKGRSETWAEWEVARIAKRAWRDGYRGLAALLAVAWDTQFSPVDCRMLTPAQRVRDTRGGYFDTSRAKTGKDAIGTLSKRTEQVLDAYLAALPIDLHADAPIFRNRSGTIYSKDTLGDDFRDIRAKVFPGDTRRIMDIRRTGAVEALAGGADLGGIGNKMANSLAESKALQKVYLPKRTASVRLIDDARKRGRKVLGENG
jgi:hypothetical protein